MAEKEAELLCIGNALVDVFARGNERLAARYGISRPVQHVEIEKLKELLSFIPEYNAVSGGGAANVAKIAGFLGAKVIFSGAIGAGPDEFGMIFERELKAAGVKLRLSLKNAPTGICLFLNCGYETRIAASPSAAFQLSESDINEEELRKARVVVIDGFMLDRPGLVRHILDMADKCGTVAALDLSSPFMAREHAPEIADYIRRQALIVFMNQAEAAAFYAGITNEEPETGDEAFLSQKLCTFFGSMTAGSSFPIVVIKLGERGSMVFAGDKNYKAGTLAVKPRDVTGAGDTFAAAFLTAWVKNRSLSDCAALGNKAARVILDVAGTQVDGEKFKDIVNLKTN